MNTSQSTLIPIISPVSSLHTTPIRTGSIKKELEDVVFVKDVEGDLDKTQPTLDTSGLSFSLNFDMTLLKSSILPFTWHIVSCANK